MNQSSDSLHPPRNSAASHVDVIGLGLPAKCMWASRIKLLAKEHNEGTRDNGGCEMIPRCRSTEYNIIVTTTAKPRLALRGQWHTASPISLRQTLPAPGSETSTTKILVPRSSKSARAMSSKQSYLINVPLPPGQSSYIAVKCRLNAKGLQIPPKPRPSQLYYQAIRAWASCSPRIGQTFHLRWWSRETQLGHG
jgi:hypothetical protein